MASSFMINYYFIISIAGFLLLTFLGICCFINVEALKLKTEHKNLSGLACLVAACMYLAIIVVLYLKKQQKSEAVIEENSGGYHNVIN